MSLLVVGVIAEVPSYGAGGCNMLSKPVPVPAVTEWGPGPVTRPVTVTVALAA